MEPIQNATVYIVDDDCSVREALAWLLRTRRLPSEVFDSAEAFDARVSSGFAVTAPSCVLLDVRMAGLSGLAMFEKLIDYGLLPTLPVIFLTGHADVPTAVAAVKQGAFDFCEKPFSDNALVDRIEQALTLSAAALAQMGESSSFQARLTSLTELHETLRSMGYHAFAVRRFGLTQVTDLMQVGTSNWVCAHESMAGLVERCSSAIARCGLMPCVRGLNPLCR